MRCATVRRSLVVVPVVTNSSIERNPDAYPIWLDPGPHAVLCSNADLGKL